MFLTAVGGVLLVKTRGAKREMPETVHSMADYRIKEVHLQEEDRGQSRWDLDAAYGETFEEQGKSEMKVVTIRIHEPNREWTITSDEGTFFRDSKDVELRGH
ncbi:MAG TPA: LPS export ABC transporter periplasmic protein LptC, partial [Candidatus Methylomirabilis sp.]|nr:LPS export ABC transporter periplasmic protein LptC [Candidatus Methylomirabilis sp.]